ncbi:hypothetical protein Hanom_Chr17g01525431 [Helianthus anomalus]
MSLIENVSYCKNHGVGWRHHTGAMETGMARVAPPYPLALEQSIQHLQRTKSHLNRTLTT